MLIAPQTYDNLPDVKEIMRATLYSQISAITSKCAFGIRAAATEGLRIRRPRDNVLIAMDMVVYNNIAQMIRTKVPSNARWQ
jgi:hypothetical protein